MADVAAKSLRKDHRVTLKVVEAKGINRGDECDTYCSVRVWNNVAGGGATGGGNNSTGNSATDVSMKASDDSDAKSVSSARKTRRSTANKGGDIVSTAACKTKTVVKTAGPWFDEEFEFELTADFKELTVELYQKNLIKDKLLGVVSLPKYSFIIDSRSHEEWHALRPAHNELAAIVDGDDAKRSTKSHEFAAVKIVTPHTCEQCHGLIWGAVAQTDAQKCTSCGYMCHLKCAQQAPSQCGSLGQIRMKYVYVEDYILPISTYPKLLELLSDGQFHVVHALGRATDEREEVAKTLVTIFENSGQAVRYLQAVADAEIAITIDPNTIFRANSLGSKSIDQYMKLTAIKYLKGVLQPLITEILLQNRSCELDPTRLDSGDDKEEHFTVLEAYIKWALDRILTSAPQCPPHLRRTFQHIRATAVQKFKGDANISYTVVTAFIFLRFFNAAILGPQLFGLSTDGEPPNARNARTLTLISKTVQQLANMTPFDGKKEPFMVGLNYLVETNIGRMKKFVDEISMASDEELNKPKKKEGKSAVGKLFGVFKSGKSAQDSKATEVIDIERHLAAVHRHLMKNIDKMVEISTEAERADVLKMQAILNELLEIYDKKTRDVLAERDSLLKSLGSDSTAGSYYTVGRPENKSASAAGAIKSQMPVSIPEVAGNEGHSHNAGN